MAARSKALDAADLFGGEIQPLVMTDEQRAFVAKVNELQDSIARTMGIAKEVADMGSRVVLSMNAATDREKKPHAVKSLLTYFDDAHKRKFDGEAATFIGSQDAPNMKRLISQHGEDKLRELIDEFFAIDGDDWLTRTGYTVGNFMKRIPGLIATSKTPVRALGNTPRTAMNGRHSQAAASMIRQAYGGGHTGHGR